MKQIVTIRAENSMMFFGVSLYLRSKSESGEIYIAEPATMVRHEIGYPVPPFANIETPQAQQLMDDLWNAGIRPSEKLQQLGAIEAVKYHLEDMRRLVFSPAERTPR